MSDKPKIDPFLEGIMNHKTPEWAKDKPSQPEKCHKCGAFIEPDNESNADRIHYTCTNCMSSGYIELKPSRPDQYKAEAQIDLMHECGLMKLTNKREFLALPMEQRRKLLSEQVAIISSALPEFGDSPCDGHSTLSDQSKSHPEVLSCSPFENENFPLDNPEDITRFLDGWNACVIKATAFYSEEIPKLIQVEYDKWAEESINVRRAAVKDALDKVEGKSHRTNTNMYGISLSKDDWQSLRQELTGGLKQ
jgi:hypothetical protein